MEDLFLELLAGFFQLIFEAILEFAGEILLDLILRGLARLVSTVMLEDSRWTLAGVAILGAICGTISLALFPHHFVRPAKIHGISMVISPLLAGLAMAMVGSGLRRHNLETTRMESFSYGFAFALGVSVVRFLFAR